MREEIFDCEQGRANTNFSELSDGVPGAHQMLVDREILAQKDVSEILRFRLGY